MRTRTIRQSVMLETSPHEVYDTLINSRRHARLTGAKASISAKVGGKFSAYDGYVQGVNLELVPDERIVQLWRGSDWPEGHYSRATFTMRAMKGGTRLTLNQNGVPDEQYEAISRGWRQFYWVPLKKLFGGSNGEDDEGGVE